MPISRKTIRQDILKLLRNNGRTTYRPKEIAKKLAYDDNKTYRLFREVLAEMDKERVIAKVKGGRYTFKARPKTMEGKIEVNPQGFGFVTVQGHPDDYFVRSDNLGTAIDGDIVRIGLAAPSRGDRQREAEVLEIVTRGRTSAVGTFMRKGNFAFVEPDDQKLVNDIYVPQNAFNGAKDDDKVVVSIDRYDSKRAAPEGRVLSVIGASSDPNVRVLSLAMSLKVRADFPEEVLADAKAISVEIPESEISRRLDLREERVFTIDPVDANDFDDALHVGKLPNGNLEIGVHIADVSHYVRPNTALDAEAFKRATSVYLVDRVIPMLPEKLSNKVCSLRPGEDKLTYSCIMEVTPNGEVSKYEIRETVIHSVQRFTYEEAQSLLEGGNQDHPLYNDIQELGKLARTLTSKRMAHGSVDFDLPEIQVVLDDKGSPIDIKRKERQESNRFIEEFMLLANQSVARHIQQAHKGHAFVYRVHGQPDEERIRQLSEYVGIFGHKLPIVDGRVDSRDLNRLLKDVQGKPEKFVIQDAALRAMAKAIYTTNNIGHYGLGIKAYSHFTSPIRRYPDLIGHRLLKAYASGGGSVNKDVLEESCLHCSEQERTATEAERESVKLKQVEYILQHLGETFEGVVTGVNKFGVHVRLNGPLVEGMVHVRDMDDDYYEYDEQHYTLVGEHSGKRYRPGDTVNATVASADIATRKIDLVFA